jgi:transcriptional regulator with XRE-family HTH domain
MGKEPKGQDESDEATDEVIKIISRRLADTRKKRGLTQAQLGEKAGVRQSYIFELEQGSSSMTLRTLIRMARALEVDPRDLFPGGASAPVTVAEIEFLSGALDRLAKAIKDRVAYEKLRDEHEASVMEELKPLVDLRNALAVRTLPADTAEGGSAGRPKRPRRGITEDT